MRTHRIFSFGYIALAVLWGCGKKDNPAPRPALSPATLIDTVAPKQKTSDSIDKPHSDPTSGWQYDSSADKMRGVTIYFARLTSLNSMELEFPYNGGSFGEILLRRKGKVMDVIFSISKGQFNSRYDGTAIAAKFDNAPIQQFTGYEPEGGEPGFLFLRPTSKFISALRKAHHVTLEAPIWQEGENQLEFDADGLKW